MDIMIVKLGALGDVLNTIPLAIHLRTSLQARIHWITEPLSHPLLAEHPLIDEVILFDKYHWQASLPAVLRTIRRQHYDIALDLQRITKSALLTWCTNSARRIGFDHDRCKEATWLLPFERIPPADNLRPMALQYLEFAAYLGLPTDNVQWNIPLDGQLPAGLPQTYMALNIGATKPANRWTPEGFAALTHRIDTHFKLPCVLTGGPQDRPTADLIMPNAARQTIDLVGQTSLLQLKEVLAGARAVVSCDTGPMHLAVALGRPVVALFGPADPRRTGPLTGTVIQKDLYCVPCNRRECNHRLCMLRITPDDVIEHLDALLAG